MIEEHGFKEPVVVEGVCGSRQCRDPLCFGCATLDECDICGLAEFQHGDGNE